MTSDPTLLRWFKQFRLKYFPTEFPENVAVMWEPSLVASEDHAEVVEFTDNCFLIRIDPAIRFSTSWTKQVLLHEMSHLEAWPVLNHGKKFQAIMQRLAATGAFKDIW